MEDRIHGMNCCILKINWLFKANCSTLSDVMSDPLWAERTPVALRYSRVTGRLNSIVGFTR